MKELQTAGWLPACCCCKQSVDVCWEAAQERVASHVL